MTYGQDLNLFLVRPNIYVPDTFGVVSFLLEKKAQTCLVSDKGYYAQHSVQKFGGLDRLAATLRDSRASAVLSKFLDHSQRPEGTVDQGVHLNSDRRVYLDLPAVVKLFGDEPAGVELLDDLATREIVQRGFIFRCAYCRNSDWYSLKELGQAFDCRRCGHTQVFTRQHWKQPSQPNLYYKLDEIIYQGLTHDMLVPILTLDHLRKRAKRSFDFSPELEIWASAAKRPAMEVDICCIVDGALLVGEAKTANVLDKKRKEERMLIANYRELAADLGASAVVFATMAATWDKVTKNAIDQAFSGDAIRPIILGGGDIN